MKSLLIVSLTLLSLSAFSTEVGESEKSDCKFANQEKREAKGVIEESKEVVKEQSQESKAVSK